MTPEEITALFPEAAMLFPPLPNKPNDDTLSDIREIITPLLLNLEYDMNGPYNLAGLIQDTAAYTARWHNAFARPVRPTIYNLTIPDDASPVVRNRMEAMHKALVVDFDTFTAAKRGVVKFIRDIVDELWYKDLKSIDAFYMHVTGFDLLRLLESNCSGLHPTELVSLSQDMLGFYARTNGILENIDELKEVRRKLARGNLPMSDDAVLVIALTSVMALQHFSRAMDDWEALWQHKKCGQHGRLHSTQLTQHGSCCRRPPAAPDPLVTR
jgi:hypothetical protein